MKINLKLPSSMRILSVLMAIILILIVFSTIGQVSKYYLGHGRLLGFISLFYLDYESNIPTWFSSFMLLNASVLLFVIAISKNMQKDLYWFQWAFLSAIFFYLSIDEIAMLHEHPIEPLRDLFNAGGFLYYTWVVPAVMVLFVLGIYFWKFLLHLPARSRMLFITAAAFYIGGAIGIEMISGYQADLHGEKNMGYVLIITAEEMCEMIGVAVFIYALRQYLPSSVQSVTIHVK
ncbi:hypothetical protein [Desulfobacula toluolica]|uniref:Uncharacterized membrane protein n=1 Tax=Desulfobacula toluolica (strain DSM 7467 / Tol2) TaxID=651182 RepID=K0NIX2_DESTT|nr:hypothetical protein [Desulfobacula toluolica]CCK78922.1 uncharacterized membrane protein [Desulfobacula toluolica Tol2]